MWDRSYRWQRHVRVAAGCAVILALIVAAVILSGTSAAARTRAGARDLARELFSPAEQIIRMDVPAALLPRVGTLVYRQREDGVAQVIGRVVAVEAAERDQVALTIRLSAPSASLSRGGGVIKGAPAALSMRDAVRLLHANAHHMTVASEPISRAVARISAAGSEITSIRRLSQPGRTGSD